MNRNRINNARNRPIYRKKKKSLIGIFFRYILFFFCCGTAGIISILFYYASDLPDLSNLKTAIRNPSVIMQTYEGEIIGSYGDLYEDVITVEELPKHVPAAFMAVEDKRFLKHFGIDFIGFFRATYKNFMFGRVVEGGSTITQQLAKNILIGEGMVSHYDRSVGRKIKELLMAVWLEKKFSKSQIMMMYLNRVYFGAGTYGIDAASRKYFGKKAVDLSVYEAAVLAGILKAPSKYSPSSHPDLAKDRTFTVLKAMEDQNFIKSASDVEKKESDKALHRSQKTESGYLYFCDFVYDQAKKILGDIEDDIVVVTTLNTKKQKIAEESISYYLKTEGERYKISQMALVSMGRDGKIDAMVGGVNYTANQFNRVTQSMRLSGSAFKIFVYGAALEYGYQLTDMISDAPASVSGWKPMNYKWKTRGQISFLDGFTYSVNSVSIRLAQAIGLRRIARFAEKLGIDGVSTEDMSVAIGTTPVTLKDITGAYTSFMDGLPIWPYGIFEIRTKSGKVLYQRDEEVSNKIIDDETLNSCRTLLRSVVARGTGRATNVNEYVFGKTGTNGDYDAWFIGFYDPSESDEYEDNEGYDDSFSVGVWVGNDNNKLRMTHDSTGGRVPARIARRFIENVIKLSKNKEDPVKEEVQESEKPKKRGLASVLDEI